MWLIVISGSRHTVWASNLHYLKHEMTTSIQESTLCSLFHRSQNEIPQYREGGSDSLRVVKLTCNRVFEPGTVREKRADEDLKNINAALAYVDCSGMPLFVWDTENQYMISSFIHVLYHFTDIGHVSLFYAL